MSAPWPTARLKELLTPVSRPEKVQAGKTYRLLGARWYAGGLFIKDTCDGSGIRATKVYRVERGDFVYNRLFAWKGSFAFADDTTHGCYVSNEFPCFHPHSERVEPRYLQRYMSREKAWTEALGLSSGGTPTSRNRLKEEKLLGMEIPLPPLVEQRRIVAQIDKLAAQINEARALRRQAVDEAEALHLSVLHQHFVTEGSSWTPMPMDEAVEINDKQVVPTLPEYSRLPHISGENMEGRTCRLLQWRTAEVDGVKSNNYLFSSGTVLYSKIRPYLRKAVFVDFPGVCSADVYPIRIKSQKLNPHFVKWSLVADPFTDYANQLSGRTRMPKLNRRQLFGFGFSHPPLPEQCRIVAELDALQAEVDALKRLQTATAAELDALLPAILDRAFKGEL